MTETRETKIRTFEQWLGEMYKHNPAGLSDTFIRSARIGWDAALEEAAQMFPEDKWEAVAKWIRSLSSKKDSNENT